MAKARKDSEINDTTTSKGFEIINITKLTNGSDA
jgi:hypothetical protein